MNILKRLFRKNKKILQQPIFMTGNPCPHYSENGFTGGKTTIISDMALTAVKKMYSEKMKQ